MSVKDVPLTAVANKFANSKKLQLAIPLEFASKYQINKGDIAEVAMSEENNTICIVYKFPRKEVKTNG
jgi:bifunctional DNA-binding transcriptional regulator/antitoxin component of YhaV-PrlF toxin-antitoxin module